MTETQAKRIAKRLEKDMEAINKAVNGRFQETRDLIKQINEDNKQKAGNFKGRRVGLYMETLSLETDLIGFMRDVARLNEHVKNYASGKLRNSSVQYQRRKTREANKAKVTG